MAIEARSFQILKERKGATFVSTLIAAGIIVIAILGVGASSLRMSRAIRKAEVVNLAIAVEANLVAAFHDKRNYPDPNTSGGSGTGRSPNSALRAGTLTTLPLQVAFLDGAPITVPVPISEAGAVGPDRYLDSDLNPCVPASGTFTPACVIRYNVALKKTLSPNVSYAYSYKVEADPAVTTMAPLGNINDFNIPIDPGNYRADVNLTNCNKDSSLFVTGVNRDTGEVFCAKKPKLQSCPKGTMTKGLKYVPYENQPPAIELNCTSNEMRVYKCPPNYALQKFNPQYIDPENTTYSKAPGKCVFLGSNSSVSPGNFPSNPTAPYMRTVAGTFCPPFYASKNTGCTLIPDHSKNNSIAWGLGRCAPTKHKNCQRNTYTRISDNGLAYSQWLSCRNSVSQPVGGCGLPPANPVYTTTCSITQTSTYCDGVPNSSSSCDVKESWTSGTAYADTTNSYSVSPSAVPIGTPNGRKFSCTYQDVSPACTAPSTDFYGNSWDRKNPKWYGGVQVQGVTCSYDTTLGKPEVVDAI